MEKRTLLYEGKAKKIFATDEDDTVIIYYKDDATADNANKHTTVNQKGIINNAITARLFERLERCGIKTHFIKVLSDREQLCTKVDIIPLEVIVRNIIAGSMARRLGIAEGTEISNTILELSYKNDDLGDPLINDHHAVAMNIASYDDISYLYKQSAEINTLLQGVFADENIILVDFKVEYGRTPSGEIVLADEITPDTCRLWDMHTKQKLDKDRFREDLGGIEEAYLEILSRLTKTKL